MLVLELGSMPQCWSSLPFSSASRVAPRTTGISPLPRETSPEGAISQSIALLTPFAALQCSRGTRHSFPEQTKCSEHTLCSALLQDPALVKSLLLQRGRGANEHEVLLASQPHRQCGNGPWDVSLTLHQRAEHQQTPAMCGPLPHTILQGADVCSAELCFRSCAFSLLLLFLICMLFWLCVTDSRLEEGAWLNGPRMGLAPALGRGCCPLYCSPFAH